MTGIVRIMFGSKMIQCSVEFMVHRKGHLEDLESISINALERVLLVVLIAFLRVLTDSALESLTEGRDWDLHRELSN